MKPEPEAKSASPLTRDEHTILSQLVQFGLQGLSEMARTALLKVAPPEELENKVQND